MKTIKALPYANPVSYRLVSWCTQKIQLPEKVAAQWRWTRGLTRGAVALLSVVGAAAGEATGWKRAEFVEPPAFFIGHDGARQFVAPGMFRLGSGEILLAAPWGRPPANFEQIAQRFPVPPLFRSRDGGRTWREEGALKMEWNLTGMISDGGISFLKLADGRLAILAHRHLPNNKGGALPVIAFSKDDGVTWSPARIVGEGARDDANYVMNDRLIQLRSGRLLVPVAHEAPGSRDEGDVDESLCFYSDDGGASWRRSQAVPLPTGPRGMPEPCVVERRDGSVLMVARSGTGFLLESESRDGGATWSAPRNTTLVSPCSSLTLHRLPDGRLIVFYNHAAPSKPGWFFPRAPLVYGVSADDGATWGAPVIVDDEGLKPGENGAATTADRDLIYPAVCFLDEGMLVVWSSHFSSGDFRKKTAAERLLGGGKRAILKYPAR